ncbi:MAG: hypothetical protein AAF533_26380 [Acidobacteriota bacterium]
MIVIALGLLATTACRAPEPAATGGVARAVATVPDLERLPPGRWADFTDLPGVTGFAELTDAGRSEVLERANSTRCTCGCQDHTINHCLHQHATCEVALRLATGFVEDARAFEKTTTASEPPRKDAPEEDDATAATDPTGEESRP